MSNHRTLEKLKAQLVKSYDEKSVMFASEIPAYDVISSGSLSLDYAIGIGGLPTNRSVEIAGAPGTGKTTLVLHAVNNALNKFKDRFALYIDIENRLTPDWVESFVDDMDRVLVVKPDTMEQATDMYREAVTTGEFCVAVLDSIGGAPTQRVTGKSAEKADVGGNALAVGRFARFSQTLAGKYDCLTIGINQIRADMGGWNRLVTPGGKAWEHAVSLRIELKKGREKVFDKINGEELQVGYPVVAKIHKNSLAAPFRAARYWFYNVPSKYGFGVDAVHELSNLALLTGVVEQRAQGSFFHETFEGGKIRGRAKVLDFFTENKEAFEQIREEVLDKLKDGVAGIARTFDEDTGAGAEEEDFLELS